MNVARRFLAVDVGREVVTMRLMDPGPAVLLFGLLAAAAIALTPRPWLKALGGLVIVVTVIAIVIDAARLFVR